MELHDDTGSVLLDGQVFDRLTAARGGGSSVREPATLLAEADREAGGLYRFARAFALVSGALLAVAGVAQAAALW